MEADASSIQAALDMTTTINLEVYYWWCTALMVIIHAGFLAYEMGASRMKNALASGVKNILAFAFLIPCFYLFGWWIYLSFPTGSFVSVADGLPWAAAMGPNLSDNATGVFWAAFTLFAATTASIMSGSVIERIRVSGFIILAILLGSVVWITGAAWGWHPEGWLTTEWGFHDFGAAGCVHTVAGFFALGVLINLGPRIGRFGPNGESNPLYGHSVPMTIIGLMMIIVGFFGFLGGCAIYFGTEQWQNIFGQPMTLSAIGFNTLMGFGGGIIGAFLVTRDPFWMMSGALAGIISAASGLDLYYPPLAFLIGFIGGCIIYPANALLEKLKIDDAVGAWAVHGVAGVWAMVALGIFGSGYPQANGEFPPINLLGMLGGAAVMILLGFIPGYVASLVLKGAGLLRVGGKAEIMGLDLAELPIRPYPEASVPATPKPQPAE